MINWNRHFCELCSQCAPPFDCVRPSCDCADPIYKSNDSTWFQLSPHEMKWTLMNYSWPYRYWDSLFSSAAACHGHPISSFQNHGGQIVLVELLLRNYVRIRWVCFAASACIIDCSRLPAVCRGSIERGRKRERDPWWIVGAMFASASIIEKITGILVRGMNTVSIINHMVPHSQMHRNWATPYTVIFRGHWRTWSPGWILPSKLLLMFAYNMYGACWWQWGGNILS